MTDEKARLRWFFDHTSDNVKRCALAVGAIYLDLLKQQPANAPTTVEPFDDDVADDETVNAHETPAPLVVIPTPVEPVEKKPLDDLKILPTDDDATKKRKLKEEERKKIEDAPQKSPLPDYFPKDYIKLFVILVSFLLL
jgi:hypothetical protein